MQAASRREEEESVEELDFSDSARALFSTQMSAVVAAATWLGVAAPRRPLCLALAAAYASVTAATQRSRRSLAAPLQVGCAALGVVAYTSMTAVSQRACWRVLAVLVWCCEAVCWRFQTRDLVALSFARWQEQFFATLAISTIWWMPRLFALAERLERDAGPDPDRYAPDETGALELLRQTWAEALLYGGTASLLVLTGLLWSRIWRVAPELFRLLAPILAAGVAAGVALHVAGVSDCDALSGSAACAFVAMAYAVLHDTRPAHAIAVLTLSLFACSLAGDRASLAAACFFAHVAAKFAAATRLSTLRGRVRTLPRLGESQLAQLVLPATLV